LIAPRAPTPLTQRLYQSLVALALLETLLAEVAAIMLPVESPVLVIISTAIVPFVVLSPSILPLILISPAPVPLLVMVTPSVVFLTLATLLRCGGSH
jgi:hypothetical protein